MVTLILSWVHLSILHIRIVRPTMIPKALVASEMETQTASLSALEAQPRPLEMMIVCPKDQVPASMVVPTQDLEEDGNVSKVEISREINMVTQSCPTDSSVKCSEPNGKSIIGHPN